MFSKCLCSHRMFGDVLLSHCRTKCDDGFYWIDTRKKEDDWKVNDWDLAGMSHFGTVHVHSIRFILIFFCVFNWGSKWQWTMTVKEWKRERIKRDFKWLIRTEDLVLLLLFFGMCSISEYRLLYPFFPLFYFITGHRTTVSTPIEPIRLQIEEFENSIYFPFLLSHKRVFFLYSIRESASWIIANLFIAMTKLIG